MNEVEDLKYRLKYISKMIEKDFFEYVEKKDVYVIKEEYKILEPVIFEIFYVSAMGEIEYEEYIENWI